MTQSGGNINIFCKVYYESAEAIDWHATNDNLELNAVKQITCNSGEKIILGDYAPPKSTIENPEDD